MCRFIAYLGPPVTLHSLLCAPEYGLLHQSYAPRHQRHGRINADGFGVGWYAPDVRAEPACYRTTTPMWADNSFASLAGVVSSGATVAAVRNASPGLPVDESCTAPYTHERWLFAHNGRIEGFPGPAAARLRRWLSDERTAHVQGATDSEVVFGLVLDRIDAGALATDAMHDVLNEVLTIAPGSRLNLCLSDGDTVVATACGDSLFTRAGDEDGGWVVVASEPFDDSPGWNEIRQGSLVVAARSTLDIGAIA
jgi:glutamine amidotransferase